MDSCRRPRRGAHTVSQKSRGTVYVALLRGVNVGGKNAISMKPLKTSFETLGLQDVRTFINSGNVLFRSTRTNARAIERDIDRVLANEHGLTSKAVVRSDAEMSRLVKTIDARWKPDARWKYNVIFLRHPIDSPRVLDGLVPKPEIERVFYYPGTLLWSALVSSLTRTTMLKLSGLPVYQDMTVRSVSTTRRILDLMRQMKQPH